MFITAMYIALIAGINWTYSITPLIELPGGAMWSPLDLVVGFVFVIRDFAQRQVGHRLIWAMLAGIALSWWMATPELALASALAFGVGEFGDWAIYTFTKKPFSQRILTSSLIGAPLDSVVFLVCVGLASPVAILSQTFSKLLGAYLIFRITRRRERQLASKDPAPA